MISLNKLSFENYLKHFNCNVVVPGEDCITLPVEVQVKDEPFCDVQVESVSFSLFSDAVDQDDNESEQNSLREVKLELDEMSDQENEYGKVCTFINFD